MATSLPHTALLWRSGWDLGQMARGEEIQSGDGKSGEVAPSFSAVSPLIRSSSSSQTDSQLGCELWGEEASLFLWVSLHPLRVNVYKQHGTGRLSY